MWVDGVNVGGWSGCDVRWSGCDVRWSGCDVRWSGCGWMEWM